MRKTVIEGLEKGSIPKISEMLSDFNKFGGKIYACVAAMALHNIIKDELVEQVKEATGIAAFLEKVEGASMLLYV